MKTFLSLILAASVLAFSAGLTHADNPPSSPPGSELSTAITPEADRAAAPERSPFVDSAMWLLSLPFLLGVAVKPSSVKPLPVETMGGLDFTNEAIILHSDLTEATANTNQDVEIYIPVAGECIERIAFELVTPFQETADAAFNSTTAAAALGGGGLIGAQQVNLNGTEILHQRSDTPSAVANGTDVLKITFAAMAAKNLAALNKGELRVYWRSNLPARLAADA